MTWATRLAAPCGRASPLTCARTGGQCAPLPLSAVTALTRAHSDLLDRLLPYYNTSAGRAVYEQFMSNSAAAVRARPPPPSIPPCPRRCSCGAAVPRERGGAGGPGRGRGPAAARARPHGAPARARALCGPDAGAQALSNELRTAMGQPVWPALKSCSDVLLNGRTRRVHGHNEDADAAVNATAALVKVAGPLAAAAVQA